MAELRERGARRHVLEDGGGLRVGDAGRAARRRDETRAGRDAAHALRRLGLILALVRVPVLRERVRREEQQGSKGGEGQRACAAGGRGTTFHLRSFGNQTTRD
jgi:hypothetical protein